MVEVRKCFSDYISNVLFPLWYIFSLITTLLKLVYLVFTSWMHWLLYQMFDHEVVLCMSLTTHLKVGKTFVLTSIWFAATESQ